MQDDPLRSAHLQRALNGLRQLSTSLRTATSGSLGAAAASSKREASGAPSAENPPSSNRRHSEYNEQVGRFRRQLQAGGQIDLTNLRAFARDGIPDGRSGLRAIAWKVSRGAACADAALSDACLRQLNACWAQLLTVIGVRLVQLLLGYLPRNQRKWEAVLRAKRAEYARFCKVKVFTGSLETAYCAASPVCVGPLAASSTSCLLARARIRVHSR